ncbi:carbohydrate kinase [Sporosarcina sp. Marseille-Q4943]|uniref:carbohydrate kinase n=1 Tax=Sporosarcina sp. Marseille-Q4943 TaxID=2942204 RepID=UPI00208DC3BC|nr:carbohydrate kinase [Sporosarcina sp. Marseille-Q4943]
MNEKERAVLDLIRANPYLSQQEMADTLQISRPSLANIISGLIRQGKITGRAYILPEEKEIICIGGANIDRKFHLNEQTQLGTSNPASMTVSVGGVARNIAENLGRLDHHVRLLTVAGNDSDWDVIARESSSHMDVSDVGQLIGKSTGSYSAVLDPEGELVIAMANMEIYDFLAPAYLEEKSRIISNAAMVIIDLNCPKESVDYIKNLAIQKGNPLVIIPVSSPKMNRMPSDLKGVTWFICNQDEAETYTGLSINTEADWKKAVHELLSFGAENVVVTAGSRGIMAAPAGGEAIHFPAVENVHVEDVTGAGDAFVSGLLHGHLIGEPFEENVRMGLLNAAKTLECSYTVRPDLTRHLLKKELEELQ